MSKFDDLRKQNPSWDINLFDLIKAADPSGTNRYVAFILKCIKRRVIEPEKIIEFLMGLENEKLVQFHKWYEEGLIEKKDISQYTNLGDMNAEYTKAEEKAKIREAENQIRKLHEDENWLIMCPQTYEAAKIYGHNTKWCITQHTHWKNYQNKYYYIYIIRKKGDEKYCIHKDITSGKYQLWLSDDSNGDLLNLPIPVELYSVIFKELKENNFPVGKSEGDYTMWKTADGVLMKIDDMTSTHLRNAIAKFEHVTSKDIMMKIRYMKEVLKRKDKEAANQDKLRELNEILNQYKKPQQSLSEPKNTSIQEIFKRRYGQKKEGNVTRRITGLDDLTGYLYTEDPF
jgi:hypothetical protein